MITRICIFLGILAAVALAAAYHVVTVSGLEGDVKTLEGAKAQLQAASRILEQENKSCAATAARQSQAVEDLRAEGEKRAATARKAIAEAQGRAIQSEALAASILARAMPVPGDACASVELLIDEEIERRHQ